MQLLVDRQLYKLKIIIALFLYEMGAHHSFGLYGGSL